MFRSDFEDGSWEQLLLAPQPLFMGAGLYLRPLAGDRAVTGAGLALFALMINLPSAAIGALVVCLALGTACSAWWAASARP